MPQWCHLELFAWTVANCVVYFCPHVSAEIFMPQRLLFARNNPMRKVLDATRCLSAIRCELRSLRMHELLTPNAFINLLSQGLREEKAVVDYDPSIQDRN